MRTADYPEVPDDFGHWLAGFIDGEGHFAINPTARGRYKIDFALLLRDDDRPGLETIIARTGLGHLAKHARSGSSRPGAKPAVSWQVTSKRELLRLVELLDAHPLRMKKARDYAVWREAVLLWATMNQRRGRGKGGGKGRAQSHNWDGIIRLHRELQMARAYDPSVLPPAPELPPQLF